MRGALSVAAALVIGAPHAVSAQCPDGSPPPCAPRATPPAPTSVAVLYFENQSPDSGDAYLADGLTEAIIQALAGVPRLRVQSRHAVRRFRTGPARDLATVGRDLHVTHVVTGSVRRSGERLRIRAELVRASSGVQVWGQQYDRGTADMLDIESDIATDVATGIVGRLLPHERAAVEARPTNVATAYQYFMEGNFYLARRDGALFPRAVEAYRAALQRDPTFTRPLGRLAYAHALAIVWGFSVPGVSRDSILPVGLTIADDALARDPRDPEAWLGLGYLRTFADPVGYAGALEALQRSVELDAGNAEAWHQYGSVLLQMGGDSAADVAFRRALDIDPTRMISWAELSLVSTIGRRYAESLRLLDRAVALEPTNGFARYVRALVLLMIGDTTAARSDIEVLRTLGGPEAPDLLNDRITVRSGDQDAIDQVRRAVVALADSQSVTRNEDADDMITLLIPVLLGVGERERALRMLEAVQPRGRTFALFLRWPECDPLRDDPRFQRLVAEAGRP